MTKVTSWVRWLGLITLLFALASLVLSLIHATTAQELAVALMILGNRMALAAAVLGIAVAWQRRRWLSVSALALAGLATLMSGPISDAINTNAPFIVGPLIVGALALTLVGLPGLPRAAGSSARSVR
ncbi:MAG TPA: hypothetical protein VFQ25_11475 [Ktedonobacterales bacterium]|nr:hypothetical protein [Ktedonobacterales bacterium]